MRTVAAAGINGTARKAHPWNISPKDFFDESEEARTLFARLIDARPDDVAIIPAVSYGMAIAAANLQVNLDDVIVVLADQFPSNVYPWKELVRQRGAKLITVPRPDDGDWTTALLSSIDERACVVALPYCHWTDGTIVHLEKISARCRQVHASLVLDLTQSLGAAPFSVNTVRPDFAVAAAYKWLLGPYSMGFIYVAPRYQTGRPLEHNWINRIHSEDFAGLVNYRNEFQSGARRFDVGERSNFALIPMAVAALHQILDWEVPRIADTLSAMTDKIGRKATELGLTVSPAHLRVGHLVGLRFPKRVPPELSARLTEKKIYVSIRGDCVRVSPHLYNTDEDSDRLFEVLEAVLHHRQTGTWPRR